MRAMIESCLPKRSRGIAYCVPCVKVGGEVVAGFGHFRIHNTYFPRSGSITA